MDALKALKPILYIAALTVVVLLLLGVAVSRDYARHLVPAPDMVAQQLLTALNAQRYAGVEEALSEELRAAESPESLRALAAALHENRMEWAHGEGYVRQGERALAKVTVRTSDERVFSVDLPLKRERGIWKVASLASLRSIL